jgi:hypothetical protein
VVGDKKVVALASREPPGVHAATANEHLYDPRDWESSTSNEASNEHVVCVYTCIYNLFHTADSVLLPHWDSSLPTATAEDEERAKTSNLLHVLYTLPFMFNSCSQTHTHTPHCLKLL